jgi:hypothetical protein
MTPEEFKADIKLKQSQGKKVMISLGGGGQRFTLETEADRQRFIKSVEAICSEFGFDGIDIDFETPSLELSPGETDPKHPTTADRNADGKVDPSAKGVGALDYDSFADCRPDERRRESLVFQSTPPAGTYLVYAGLFDACGEAGVTFDVSLHVDDGDRLVETFRKSVQLTAMQADGGNGLGTFITSFDVE